VLQIVRRLVEKRVIGEGREELPPRLLVLTLAIPLLPLLQVSVRPCPNVPLQRRDSLGSFRILRKEGLDHPPVEKRDPKMALLFFG
jgi:hypothetical protein